MTTAVKKDKKNKVIKDGAVLFNELLQTVLQLDLSRDLNIVKSFLTFFDKLYHAFDGYDLIQKRLTVYKEQVFDIYVFKGTNVRGLYIATVDLINELIPLIINPDKCVLPVKKLTDLVGAVKKYFSEQTDENINNVYHKLTNLAECVVNKVRQSFDKGDIKFCIFLSELQQRLFEALNIASRNSVNTVQFIFDDVIRIFPYFLSYDDLKGYYYF